MVGLLVDTPFIESLSRSYVPSSGCSLWLTAELQTQPRATFQPHRRHPMGTEESSQCVDPAQGTMQASASCLSPLPGGSFESRNHSAFSFGPWYLPSTDNRDFTKTCRIKQRRLVLSVEGQAQFKRNGGSVPGRGNSLGKGLRYGCPVLSKQL